MNWHYLLIIGAIFVLFISMGDNPFEAPEGWVPPDEFKDGIKQRISGPQEGFSGVGGLNKMGSGNYGNFKGVNPSINTPGSIQTPPAINNPKYGIGNSGATQPYPATNYGNSGSNYISPEKPLSPNFQQQLPNQNAPAPFQHLPSDQSLESGGYNSYRFPDGPDIRTLNGQPIKFTGSTVYTLNDQGRMITLPNGTYYLNDGRSIRVVDGKNIMPVNVNQFN